MIAAAVESHPVIVALLRRGVEILLVQQGLDDPIPTWALPGGVVEAGELLSEALAIQTDVSADMPKLSVAIRVVLCAPGSKALRGTDKPSSIRHGDPFRIPLSIALHLDN